MKLDPVKFCVYSEEILKMLSTILKSDYSKKQEYFCVVDNAKSSLFKIAVTQKDCIVVKDDTIQTALKFLPLIHDIDEAKTTNKLLIQKVAENCESLFGNENCNAKEISEAMTRIVDYNSKYPKKKVIDEELIGMLENLDLNQIISHQ